ncbi:MAG: shikimate dehydrogenase [Pseudomonadota bacterium]
MTQRQLTLASGSAIRASILRNHDVNFQIIKPGVDEDIIKQECATEGVDLETTAMRLAEAKCLAVASRTSGYVVGSDQILEFQGRPFDKPRTLDEARERLIAMQGKTHSLINATALTCDGEIIWRHIARPTLTMSARSDVEIDAYLDAAPPDILASVGAYQVETKLGLDLFERISGDWHAVQGLAVYPLLNELRQKGFYGDAGKNIKPVRAGVIGSPISHSLSPLIHNSWAKRCFIEGMYEAIKVAPDYAEFAAAMDRLRSEGYAGVNVTLPHKENAIRYADTVSPTAQRTGAANMLTFSPDGVHAHSSDGEGFLASLSEVSIPGEPVNVLILGAGGAARAIAEACSRLTTEEGRPRDTKIFITNRTVEKAQNIADEAGADTIPWAQRSARLENIDLLVNATSLGMHGQPALNLDLDALPLQSVVYDIVYTPLETPLIEAARGRGNPAIGGLDMLLWQAVPGFQEWFGGGPYPVTARVDDDLRELLVEELKRRGQA